MPGSFSAIHLRSGDAAIGSLIDEWLAGRGADVRHFDDVYAACASLAAARGAAPSFVMIGADWLRADELAIARYARMACPDAVIVVYGVPAAALPPDPGPRTILCRTRSEVEALLGRLSPTLARPDAARAADPPGADGPQRPDGFAADAPRTDGPEEATTATAARDSDHVRAGPAPVRGDGATAQPPRTVERVDAVSLTPEELSALLG